MGNQTIRLFIRRELRAVTVGLATAIGICGVSPAALAAGPGGGVVVSGSGSITRPSATTTLINQQSSQLTLNWTSFNVGADDTVRFEQPSATAVALNNILSQSPSQIFGKIDANGRIVLVNPNGILFGRSAQLNVGSLIASSLEVTGFDAASGRFSFRALSTSPGSIINDGTITAGRGGSVALLGGTVLNNGLVVADYGTVAMGAGKVATLDFYGGGLLRLKVSGDLTSNPTKAGAAVQNSGRIQADGGQVLLTARAANDVFASAVNNTGLVRASRIENVGGVIELSGPGGTVASSGTLDASGSGSASKGGTVKVLGQDVALTGQSVIDANGAAGGGTVYVGGGAHGANPAIEDASRTYVSPDASLTANALGNGTGGNVTVWSNDGTRFYGHIGALGSGAGAGGTAEVSGKGSLDFQGTVDLRAPSGKTGTLLLDPTQITIEHGSGTTTTAITTTGSGPFTDTSSGSGSILSDGTIDSELGSANVTVTTSAGDIAISNAAGTVAIGPTTANSSTLTLNSSAGITWNAPWSYSNSGQLTLYAKGGSIAAGATGEALTLGGFSPLLMQASGGIGTSSVPIETIGLTQLAATDTSSAKGIYLSNSGTSPGNVAVTALTNPLTSTAVMGLSTTGSDISLTNSAGNLAINYSIDAGVGGGTVTLAATTGSISEASTAGITGGTLTSSSAGGTTLGGANAVGTFNATNSTSGNVSLTNTAAPLTITGISQTGSGTTTISNAGALTTSGTVTTSGTGLIMLTASGEETIGAPVMATAQSANIALESTGGNLALNGNVDAGAGTVAVSAPTGTISQATGSTLTANDLAVQASTAPALTTSAPLSTIAADITGAGNGFSFSQSGPFSVGSVGGISGVTTNGGAISLTASSGALTVSQPVGSAGGDISLTSSAGNVALDGNVDAGTGTVAVSAPTGTISQATGSTLTASGLGVQASAAPALTTSAPLSTIAADITGAGNGFSFSQSGPFSVGSVGGISGVSTNGGPISLAATGGTLALGPYEVSGAGVTLEGVGVAQAAGSTVDAGSADILVNGGGGAISLAGALTTGSDSSTAVMVRNATTVALPSITTGTSGTTTIGAGDITGAVSQSSATVIATGTLTGNTSGPVSLADANAIPALGSFTSDGLSLNDLDPMSITGAIAGGAGGVNLTSSGSISESGGLISTTGTLSTVSVGGTNLIGANTVSTLDATNTGSGAVSLTNSASPLTIAALKETGGGSVAVSNSGDITVSGTVASGSASIGLTSTGAITESGGGRVSTSGTLTTSSVGGTTLVGANTVSGLNATNTGGGDVSLTNSASPLTLTGINETGSGSVAVSNSGGITLGGTVSAGIGSVTLTDASGAVALGPYDVIGSGVTLEGAGITQAAGSTVVAGSGDILVDGGGGAIDMAGELTTTSNSSAAVTVRNATTVALPGITTGASGGTTTIGAGDIIGAVSQSGSTAIATGTLTGDTSGTVTLTNANALATLWAFTSNGLSLDDTSPLTIDGVLNGGAGGVNLTSSGSIEETGGAIVRTTGASALTAGNGGDITLGGANTFGGNVAFNGHDVTLSTGTGGLSSSGTASGTLTETAAGAITQGGTLQVSGASELTALGGSDIILGDDANAFGGGVAFSGRNVTLTAGAGGLSASGTAAGNLTLRAEGPSSSLRLGTISAGEEVLLIAGDSIFATASPATVTANNIEVRYGIENPDGQLSSPNAGQQLGWAAASGSAITATVWAPAGVKSPTKNVALPTGSILNATGHGFPANNLFLERSLYTAPFGASVAQITQGSLTSVTSANFSQLNTGEETAGDEDISGGGTAQLVYVDWASYNPDVTLFGTLNPAVCLPADQRIAGAGSSSACTAPAAAVVSNRLRTPVLLAMMLTRGSWKEEPLLKKSMK